VNHGQNGQHDATGPKRRGRPSWKIFFNYREPLSNLDLKHSPDSSPERELEARRGGFVRPPGFVRAGGGSGADERRSTRASAPAVPRRPKPWKSLRRDSSPTSWVTKLSQIVVWSEITGRHPAPRSRVPGGRTALAMIVAAASATAARSASTVTASAIPREKLRPRQPLVAIPRTG